MRRALILIVWLAALACAGSWAASEVRSMRDRSEVATMTEMTRTVCLGRYLVDVPVGAEVKVSGETMDGFDVGVVEETEAAFRQRMRAREAEIGGSGQLLAARDLHLPGRTGRTFIHQPSRGDLLEAGPRVDGEPVAVESHLHVAGASFSLSAKDTGEARAGEAEAFLARLQRRGVNEIPRMPGFCIRAAVFADPLPAHREEQAVMELGLAGHPDLHVRLVSAAGGLDDAGLLMHVARTAAGMAPELLSRLTRLRMGRRNIHGVDGEEVLVRAREYNLTASYGFTWEAPGRRDDLTRPSLTLELATGTHPPGRGKAVGTSMHEDAVLALWDSIASSIRLRHAAPGVTPARGRDKPAQGEPQLAAH